MLCNSNLWKLRTESNYMKSVCDVVWWMWSEWWAVLRWAVAVVWHHQVWCFEVLPVCASDYVVHHLDNSILTVCFEWRMSKRIYTPLYKISAFLVFFLGSSMFSQLFSRNIYISQCVQNVSFFSVISTNLCFSRLISGSLHILHRFMSSDLHYSLFTAPARNTIHKFLYRSLLSRLFQN